MKRTYKNLRVALAAYAMSVALALPALAAPSLSEVANANQQVVETQASVQTQTQVDSSNTQVSQSSQNEYSDLNTKVADNSALINELAGETVIKGRSPMADKLLKKLNPLISGLCIILAHLIALWIPAGTLLDLTYILVTPLRGILSGGAEDKSRPAGGGGFGGGLHGGFSSGVGYGQSTGWGSSNGGFGSGDGITASDSPYRSKCWVSNEALMCVNSQQAQQASPLKLYFKAMVIKVVLSGVILVFILSGILMKIGVTIGYAISNGIVDGLSGI